MGIQYYYELIVNGFETYWRVYIFVGGSLFTTFAVAKIKGLFKSKISGGSDWTKN